MKKSTLLLSLLLMATGAGAKVITTAPVAGTPYTIKCIATDHTGNLADDGTTLQGRAANGTNFILESNGTEGQYYLKSQVSNKYVNAAGNTSGAAVTFDATPTTYWTIDQEKADTSKNSWAIRPNGTAGVSLNNNGSADAACPWMKINVHNSSTQGCDLWTFDDNEVQLFGMPKFGGTVWTWDTQTSKFNADGKEATATPGRENNYGPVYKFDNVGTVTTAVNTSTDTSDKGGVWVIGSTSNVTSSMGRWAGAILVEDGATGSFSYSTSLKGDGDATDATVWTNGTLSITGRTTFDMNDGGGQRWYIGENGVVNTNFTTVTKGNRSWDIQVVVADQPERQGVARSQRTLTKKVMTWGGDISSNINSIKVFHKDDAGTYTQLESSVVKYDNTGITIEYLGLGYDEMTPSLPEGQYISVASSKAGFLTPATGAADNAHWYLLTQTRGTNGEVEQLQSTPVYDNGANTLVRASLGTEINGQLISGNEKYLVRFFENGEGTYDIQFATGNFVTPNLTTGKYNAGGTFNLYNISDEATHIGWNKADFANIVDNNGVGNSLSYWNSGQVTNLNGNNDWSLYLVDFVDGNSIEYTIHSEELNVDYTGSYTSAWAGDNTLLPTLEGAAGYTLTDVVFAEADGKHTLTANITFPFPVSGATAENATGIESALGNSKWFATEENKIKANNAANTNLTISNQDQFKWYIYPSFADGVFSFKIKNSNGMYIPAVTSQDANTENALVEEASAGSYYFIPCVGNGKGFSTTAEGPIFLSINTSGQNQNIWGWSKPANAGHQGSNLTFPEIAITAESVKAQFDVLKSAPKFDILEGSIVQGPSEFANPTEINAAIEAAEAIGENDIDAMEAFLSSDNAAKINNYLANMQQYGTFHTCHLTITKQYGTLMLPCPSTRPEGLQVYQVSGVGEDNKLALGNPVNIVANTPYVIEAEVGAKYTIIGWLKDHSEPIYTSGWLTGVYPTNSEANVSVQTEEGVTVPEGSYVLGEHNGRQAFVKSDGTATCAPYECYLTPGEGAAAADAYYFTNPGTTSISEISAENAGVKVIYDLQGRRLSAPVKGINIINGKKVLVR